MLTDVSDARALWMLISDLRRWGEVMEAQDAAPDKGSPTWLASCHDLDAQGMVLAESLQRELADACRRCEQACRDLIAALG